jgi:hypothetical protein
MNTDQRTPSFNQRFPELHHFILRLVAEYQDAAITSWEDLESRVTDFFTPDRMEQMESVLPHWRKMASYREGVTLTHVMCVFLGLYMLPEYQSLTTVQQNLMQWAILLHDVEKEAKKGQRDTFHAFRSAVTAAQRLPAFGFQTTGEYEVQIAPWSELVLSACIRNEDTPEPIQDNRRYPEILAGIDQMFGNRSAAAAIVKTVLFHMSVTVVREWPQAAPLTIEEMTRYVDGDRLPLLKAMMLADNEGWSMFCPDRDTQRTDTLEAFGELEKLIR